MLAAFFVVGGEAERGGGVASFVQASTGGFQFKSYGIPEMPSSVRS